MGSLSVYQRLIKKLKFILIPVLTFFLITVLTETVFAQKLTKFSDEPEAFISEIKAMFKDYSEDKVVNTISTFTDLIKKQTYNAEELKIIIETSNVMLKKHYNASPNFENYFNVLIAYKTSNAAFTKLNNTTRY
jgi:hypothetical protein